jgi:hypothetical protein
MRVPRIRALSLRALSEGAERLDGRRVQRERASGLLNGTLSDDGAEPGVRLALDSPGWVIGASEYEELDF